MVILDYILLAVPVLFLVGSVIYAYKTVSCGRRTRKRAVLSQIASFAAVGAVCLTVAAITAFAAEGDPAAAADAVPKDGMAFGLAMLGAALATGISGIGGGIAVGNAAPAAIGATSEDPKAFGKALIFVALGEGVALYGLLVSILIISKV
ncbi:MAG: hypothetical protein IJU51_05065 [Clostridia bacterium]|nr:hypothetical protein [Clostridia bacterium]